jgi:hypothetical protein
MAQRRSASFLPLLLVESVALETILLTSLESLTAEALCEETNFCEQRLGSNVIKWRIMLITTWWNFHDWSTKKVSTNWSGFFAILKLKLRSFQVIFSMFQRRIQGLSRHKIKFWLMIVIIVRPGAKTLT